MGDMTPTLLNEPSPTYLTPEPGCVSALAAGTAAAEVARSYPACPEAWAAASEAAWAEQRVVESYAFARVGYHRGLDALRRHGWKGHGPIPWEHEGNRGFLRCLAALGRASAAIGEDDEAQRCAEFLHQASPTAADQCGTDWLPHIG